MSSSLKRSKAFVPSSVKATADAARAPATDAAFLSALGRNVRSAREQRELSRKTLAGAANVSERYLAQLEMGGGNASVVLLRRIADALNLSLPFLLTSSTNPNRILVDRFLDSVPEHRLDDVLRQLVNEFGNDAQVRRKRIALIGLRGAGKSTLGSSLAKILRRPFVELDREIELDAGMGLSEIFMLYGAPGYRNLERQCLERLIASQSDLVLSVGGGVVTEADSYELLLRNCFTVWIKASPREHMSRVVAQGDLRPMRGHSRAMEDLEALLTAREPLYGRADAVVDTAGQSISKSLAALRLAIAPKGT
jgi:XRE family aerobic/anaerobic benzoate catabolism transcriptional regulator